MTRSRPERRLVTRSGSRYVPDRGDVVWLSFAPQAGHEQSGRRPAVVLSPANYNAKAGLALVVPVTSQVKGYPFEIVIPHGLPVGGAVLTDQLRSLDWKARKAERITTLPAAVVRAILERCRLLLEPAG